jgi:hypothetical protein
MEFVVLPSDSGEPIEAHAEHELGLPGEGPWLLDEKIGVPFRRVPLRRAVMKFSILRGDEVTTDFRLLNTLIQRGGHRSAKMWDGTWLY